MFKLIPKWAILAASVIVSYVSHSEAQVWTVRTEKVERIGPKGPKDYGGSISRTRRLVSSAVARVEADARHFVWVRARSETYGIRGPVREFDAAVQKMRSEKERMDKATSSRTFFNAAENVIKYVELAEKYHAKTDVYVR